MLYTSHYDTLSSVPHAEMIHTLLFEAAAAREMLAHVWCEETAYQGIDLVPDDIPSRGQCGVSSLWLARYLFERAGDDVTVQFVEGITKMDGLNSELVWVEVAKEELRPIVVDITHDQYRTVNGARVHVGHYESKPENIGLYTVSARFNPWEVPRRKLLGRFDILQQAIDRLPPWQRIDTGMAKFLGGIGLGICQ